MNDAKIVQEIRNLRRHKLRWSLEENSFRNREGFRHKDYEEFDSNFSACADAGFRESVFGVYLKSFNEREDHNRFLNENKLGITQWDVARFSEFEFKEFSEKNLLTDGLFDLLLKAAKNLEVIDWCYLHNTLVSLRLSNCNMLLIDVGLKKFKYLVVLILTGNFLQKIPGELLPRNVQFLEVYANEISELKSLVINPPERLLHIGLGRNNLLQMSDCHLLCDSQSFQRLRTLDLADNDFSEVQPLVEILSALQSLQSLNLEGNPCSVCVSYKDVVLEILPHLKYLDTVELLKEDKNIVDSSHTDRAVVVFTCHRITGLRAPPKEKNAKQTIHVEVNFPLLEEIDFEELNPPQAVEESPPTTPQLFEERKASSKSLDKKSIDRKSVKSKGSSSVKGGKAGKTKEPGPYDAPDEYEKETRNAPFKTERIAWAKTMQFPEDAVIVETSESDLVNVRDTFRSCVEVKVVYLKTIIPTKGKKGKKGKDKKRGGKEKEGSKKGKKKEKVKSTTPEKVEEEPEKPPEEIILKKVTLAKFHCDLHNINWSDKTIDYYWAQHQEVGDNAIPVESSLRAITYAEGKGGGDAKGKKKDKKGSKSKQKEASEPVADDTSTVAIVNQKIPNYMTVQVGFGLMRSHFPTTQPDLQ